MLLFLYLQGILQICFAFYINLNFHCKIKFMKTFFKTVFVLFALFVAACSSVKQNSETVFCSEENCADKSHIKSSVLFAIAMPDESKYIEKEYGLKKLSKNISSNGKISCITTGVGKNCVNSSLKNTALHGNVLVINVGYCGSNVISKGEMCKVNKVAKIETPNAISKISDFGGVPCFSSDKFVEETDIKEPCVFDMELFYFHKKFPNLISYKIVSDNLSHSEYEGFKNFNANDSWKRFFKTIAPALQNKN